MTKKYSNEDENEVLCFLYYFCPPRIWSEWGKKVAAMYFRWKTFLCTTQPSPHQEKIKVFSNYGDGLLIWGKEYLIKNYMELSEDPKGDWMG